MSNLSDRLYLLEYKERMKEKEMADRQKQIEAIQRKKEQEKEFKEYEKGLLLACKKDLKSKFEEEFELQGIKAKYQFYNVKTRDTLIKSIAKNEIVGDYLETNYNKILNEVVKKYALHKEYQEEQEKEIARQYAEKMAPVWEEERKKQARKNVANNIFNFLLAIFQNPILLFVLIVMVVLVWIFMGALGFGFFRALAYSFICFIVLVCILFGFIK